MKKLVQTLFFLAAAALLAGCMSTPHAYPGEKLEDSELAMLCSAGVGGTLSITGVNGRDVHPLTGGSLSAYVKPGDNKVRFYFTTTDFEMQIQTTVDWEVSFTCEQGHTYVFYPIVKSEDEYYLAGYDMGTEYVYDVNKPLGLIQMEAQNKGETIKFHKEP